MDAQRVAGRAVRAEPDASAGGGLADARVHRARPTTPCRRRGSGSAAPTRTRSRTCGGWLTTVVSRICLDMLRARQGPARGVRRRVAPEPVVAASTQSDPEQEALIADGVGLALLVVLETLSPAERLAFVLHDMFGVPFEEIASDRRPQRRPPRASWLAGAPAGQGRARPRCGDLGQQRKVVEAFLAASRDGDFEALLEVLDPDVVFRAESGATGPRVPASVRRRGRGRERGADTRKALRSSRPPGSCQRKARRGGGVPRSRRVARRVHDRRRPRYRDGPAGRSRQAPGRSVCGRVIPRRACVALGL